MNWYIAKIIYQVISGKGDHVPQFDEQFRLIRADEISWAWEKAHVIARMEQSIFKNCKEEDVLWKFVAVEDVCHVENLEDGAQVYAQTTEPECANEYIALRQARSKKFLQADRNRTSLQL